MTRHTQLPTLNITDRASVFVSQVIQEVAETLSLNLKHATTKHAEKIRVLERAHAKITTSLKMASDENRKYWHKYLFIAILNYNTTYRSSIDCEPSRIFHGRVPHNILDHKLGLSFITNIKPTIDFADEQLCRTKLPNEKTKENVVQSYIKYEKRLWQKSKSFLLSGEKFLFFISAKRGPSRF